MLYQSGMPGVALQAQKQWTRIFKFRAGESRWKDVPRPTNRIRALAYDVCSHPAFDAAIMFSVISNVLARSRAFHPVAMLPL